MEVFLFRQISEIDPNNFDNIENDIFITIDVDWAPDFVWRYTFDILEKFCVPSTWMITHQSSMLKSYENTDIFELGIHPNFNDLLFKSTDAQESIHKKLQFLTDLVPSARVVRSHSMTQNSRLLDRFQEFGLTHDCNHYIPFSSQIKLKPWRIWNGLIKVPFGWEDDLDFPSTNENFIKRIKSLNGLKVFNFHPIHIFLNSTSMRSYEETRSFHNNEPQLLESVNRGYGTREFLLQLIDCETRGY
jgi:hypothetical protein